MAQKVRKLEDMPKVFPIIKRKNIVSAIKNPESNHDHGCKKKSINQIYAKVHAIINLWKLIPIFNK